MLEFISIFLLAPVLVIIFLYLLWNKYNIKNKLSVYSVGSIVLGSFFGGPITNLFMVYKNSIALSKRIPAMKFCLIVFLNFLVYFGCIIAGYQAYCSYRYNDTFDPMRYFSLNKAYYRVTPELLAWQLLPIVIYSLLVWLVLDKKNINDFLKKGSKKRNFFDILLLLILSLFVMSFFWTIFSVFSYNTVVSNSIINLK